VAWLFLTHKRHSGLHVFGGDNILMPQQAHSVAPPIAYRAQGESGTMNYYERDQANHGRNIFRIP
jgi:TfoX/Sxy family transcriptional regulator of competence genes